MRTLVQRVERAAVRLPSGEERKTGRGLLVLLGVGRGGRRPDFTSAEAPQAAKPLYERFVQALRELGLSVKTGEFGAMMAVESVNDGPVTLWLDTAAF
jgi:D-Tyr-tRNAtyr deacylase